MSIQWSGGFRPKLFFLAPATQLTLVLLISGCGMHLRPEPNGIAPTLGGQWQLHTPQREALANTLRTAMEQARDKQDQRERRDARRRPEPDINLSPPDPATDASDKPPGRDRKRIAWEAREQIEQQEALLNAVLPSDTLQILQTSTRIELIPSIGGRRRFDMGVTSTLVTNYATFRIESGWQANVFVVHSKDAEQHIDIVERYQRLGDRLRMQVQLNVPDAKDQMFTADYVLAQP